MADYTYSIQNDFPNQLVDAGALTAEIEASTTIVQTLSGIGISGDVVTVTFVLALGDPTETDELDTIVGAHQGPPVEVPEALGEIPIVAENKSLDTSDQVWGAIALSPAYGENVAAGFALVYRSNNCDVEITLRTWDGTTETTVTQATFADTSDVFTLGAVAEVEVSNALVEYRCYARYVNEVGGPKNAEIQSVSLRFIAAE